MAVAKNSEHLSQRRALYHQAIQFLTKPFTYLSGFHYINKSGLPVKCSCGSLGILWQYLIPLFLMMLIISIKQPIALLIQHLMVSLQTAKISSLLFLLCDVQMWYFPQSDSDY